MDTDWFNANNWDPVGVPEAADDALIGTSDNDPIITGGTAVATLVSMFPNTALTVAEDGTLAIAGENASFFTGRDVTINGNLTITSGLFIALSHNAGVFRVGENGSVGFSGCGFTVADTMTVAGSVTVTEPNLFGFQVSLEEAVMIIEETGTVTTTQAGFNGGSIAGEVTVNGSLLLDQSVGAGIELGSTGDITIGAQGQLTVTNSGGDGIDATAAGNPISNEGLLAIAGSGALAMDAGAIDNAASATLRVDGAVTAAVTFATGSRLEPGSSPGCVDFGLETDLTGVTLAVDIEGPTMCAQYDMASFAAGVNISDVALELSGEYVPEVGDEFLIIEETTLNGLTGTFAGLPEGSTLDFNGATLEVVYDQSTFVDMVILRVIAILPLDLLSFTGEVREKTNLLSWTTANEEDFSHFEVERSADGAAWAYRGEVTPFLSGVGSEARSYTFEDEAITAYYRLKMVDLDGSFAYSEVVYLANNQGGAAGTMLVYPNPSNGRFTVDLSEVGPSAEAPGELRLVDQLGRTVWTGSTTNGRDLQSITLIAPKAGVYLLTLMSDGGVAITQRVAIH